MKRTLICFSPIILLLFAGCLKQDNTTPAYAPLGSFTGNFTRIHYNGVKKKYDTVKANLTLFIDINAGYSVSGDTTNHVPSYGDFITDSKNMTFYDKNHSFLSKTHLNGTYAYTYDNVNLQIQSSTDTLKYLYILKKQ